MKVVMIGPFGLKVKSTMRERALPMARALVRRGRQVTVIVPPWDSPEDAGRSWFDNGVEIVNTMLPQAKGPFFHLQLTAWLVRLALDRQPDVIHLFKPKAYAGLAHLLLYRLKQFRLHKARLVVDADDWEQAWNDLNDYTPLQKRFFAWQEPWGLTHADAVTVASKEINRLVGRLEVPDSKIYYLPNGVRPIKSPVNVLKAFSVWQEELAAVAAGVDYEWASSIQLPGLQMFEQQYRDRDFEGRVRIQYNLQGRPIVLLYTRFFEFELDFLVDVIDKLAQRLPEARWLVVGRGYFEEEATLAHLAQKRGLSNMLVFAGWVPMEELPHYFAAANVAVYPYDNTLINRTKCSVKLLDLLAAGVPVVASKVGQNVEYIRHGQTGFLVPPDGSSYMANNIFIILNNRQLQHAMGQAAAQHVNRVFNWDLLVEKAEAAYMSLK